MSFWFRPKAAEPTHLYLKLYDGSTYNTWYDMPDYPSYSHNEWCYFSEYITDSQYFKSNFRLSFDGSEVTRSSQSFYLDDVLIEELVVP